MHKPNKFFYLIAFAICVFLLLFTLKQINEPELEADAMPVFLGYENLFNVTSYTVIDGDTIHVQDKQNTRFKIRLTGIDAPERDQPMGSESTANLEKCLKDKDISINWTKRDIYGRVLGKVIASNTDCNLTQIQQGYAWHYKYFQGDQPLRDQRSYADAELGTRERSQGIWQNTCPTPPWQWRQGEHEVC